MKAAVIYYSQTGFTKRYAQWIAEAAGADCFGLKDAKKQDFRRRKPDNGKTDIGKSNAIK